jgi:hypothetical protein
MNVIVATCVACGNRAHVGFLLHKGAKGAFTRIDFPDAPQTFAGGINDRGQIVGIYETPLSHGRSPAEPHADAGDDVGA